MVQINFQESELTLPLKGSGLSMWEHYPPFIIGTCKRETYKHQGPQVTVETQTKPARALVGAELLRWALGPAHCEEG